MEITPVQELRKSCFKREKIITAGKGNYTFTINHRQQSMRGAAMWHIWKQHHQIECFWKLLRSVFQVRAMHLHRDGLYAALLIKVLVYLLTLHLRAQRALSKCSITQIMRKVSRDHELRDVLAEHFHGASVATRNRCTIW